MLMMARKSVVYWHLQRLKVTWLILIVIYRGCCSVALVADDLASPQHRQSPGDQNSNAAADYVFADQENVDAAVRSSEQSRRADPRQMRWATAAYRYVLGVDCQRNAFSTERECSEVQRVDRARWNVYLADPQLLSGDLRRRYLYTILPDGPLGDIGRHHRVDGVVALDPYPDANFGHLVLVFHVTIAASASWCQRRDGFLIGEGDCMVLAVKRRCRNAVERRSRRRNFDRRCEVNFIPLVISVDVEDDLDADDGRRRSRWSSHGRRRQLLTCRANVDGFSASCPSLPAPNDTAHLLCNPVRENTRNCETTHAVLRGVGGCRLFEICDRAIVVSGGWNRWSYREWNANNAARVYTMLRDHGFTAGNVKVFIANGASDINKYDNDSSSDVYPAVLKLAIRYHIRNLCSAQHCVDSLVIYLNSPTTSDGTMLLWDVDHNGLATQDEYYTLAELKSDLSECRARHVHVIVDQSYSGTLVRSLRRSAHHRHVAVYSSGRDTEYSFADDFTTAWTRVNHTRLCMKHIFREAKRSATRSHPQSYFSDSSASSGVNVFGAPCDVVPPFTYDELQHNYVGCQNLPTALWLMKLHLSSASHSSSSSSSTSHFDELAGNYD